MAKKSAVEKNNRRKKLIEKFKGKREELKTKMKNPDVTDEEFYAAQRELTNLPRNSSPVRYRNRCSITGRCRGFRRKFGISRITLREYASRGLIPGITKSSW